MVSEILNTLMNQVSFAGSYDEMRNIVSITTVGMGLRFNKIKIFSSFMQGHKILALSVRGTFRRKFSNTKMLKIYSKLTPKYS